MQRFLSALLALSFALAPAIAQDEDAPPPELDPGQVILPQGAGAERPRIELEVGRRTTFFEGPLREDGTVDYIAALNEHYSEGVTLENNAFVELLLLTPESKRSELDAQILEAIGLPPQPERDANCFVSWEEYAIENGIDDLIEGAYFLQGDNTITPEGQDWIDANQAALDRLVAATQRPRYWVPWVSDPENATGFLMGVLLNHLTVQRQFARALQARIYMAAAEGDTQEAVDDLLAIRRLAALCRHEPTIISVLVGISIDALALDTTKTLLNQELLGEQALTSLSDGWHERVAFPTMADALHIGERCMGLDALQQIWSGRISWTGVAGGFPDDGGGDILTNGFRSSRFDINQALRTFNQHYDRQAQLMQVEDYAEFTRFQERWEAQWELRIRELTDDKAELVSLLAQVGFTTHGRTEFLTSLLINIMMPSLSACHRTEVRFNTHDHVVWVALQCERYRLATGNIPPSLEALVPDYLDAIPLDPIDGQPLRYRTNDDGFVVYSVGTDLTDNGGILHDFHEEGDIAVGIGINVEPDWDE